MCWSWEVSLGTFVFCWVVSLILFIRNNRNDRFYAVFGAIFTSVQLLEFWIWIDIDCTEKMGFLGMTWNEFATRVSHFSIWLQPVSLFCLSFMTEGYYFLKKWQVFLFGLIVYVPILVNNFYYSFVQDIGTENTWCTAVGPSGCHLSWWFTATENADAQMTSIVFKGVSDLIGKWGFGNENSMFALEVLFSFGIVFPLLMMKKAFLPQIFSFVGLATCLITAFFFEATEFTSIWCFTAACSLVLVLILNTEGIQNWFDPWKKDKKNL